MERTAIAQAAALVFGVVGVLMLFRYYHLAGFPLTVALTAIGVLAADLVPVKEPAVDGVDTTTEMVAGPARPSRVGDHPGHIIFD